jgi:hypothetical protein
MGKRKSWERIGEKSGGAFLRNFPTIQTMMGQEMQRKGVGGGAAFEEQGAAKPRFYEGVSRITRALPARKSH